MENQSIEDVIMDTDCSGELNPSNGINPGNIVRSSNNASTVSTAADLPTINVMNNYNHQQQQLLLQQQQQQQLQQQQLQQQQLQQQQLQQQQLQQQQLQQQQQQLQQQQLHQQQQQIQQQQQQQQQQHVKPKELKVEDALLYLDQVKMECSDAVYNEFLEIMKNFKSQQITTPGVIERVKNLFQGHNKLILGFNTFLPEGEGFKIELTPEEQSVPQQTHDTLGRSLDQQAAISYVTTIRNRFASEPEIYRSFLKILHTYQQEKKGIKDVLEQVSLLFADHPDLLMEFTYFLPEAVQEQAKERLHRAARESEVRRRLAQASNGGGNAGGKRSRDGQPAAAGKAGTYDLATMNKETTKGVKGPRKQKKKGVTDDNIDGKGVSNNDGSNTNVNSATAGSSSGSGKVSMATKKEMAAALKQHQQEAASNIPNGHFNVTEERMFFDQVKDLMTSTSRDAWPEFVKLLELFSNDAITRKDLLSFIQPLFGYNNDDLFEEFKRLMTARTDFESSGEDIWFATPLSEIDFSQCRKCTPSYRALPNAYPKPHFSERSIDEAMVLNDNWVSIPIGSEESYSFKHMRKNQFEEALFKCEDDRFEIDMIIDSNMCTIRVLEPIAEEIAHLKQLEEAQQATHGQYPRFSFQLEKRNLSTIHLNCITRIYGDHGNEILELLKKNPAGTIPILLKRLKQKDIEWRRGRNDLNKVWKDLIEKNFEKSFDHRSFYFKQQDKRFYTTRNLVTDIKYGTLENGVTYDDLLSAGVYFPSSIQSSVGFGDANSNMYVSSLNASMQTQLALVYSNNNYDIHRDIYRLMCHCAESLNLPYVERERIAALWRDFIRVFFNIPIHFLYEQNTSAAAQAVHPMHISEAWPDNTRVITVFGSGKVLAFRESDSMYKVQLPFGIAYCRPSTILGAEELSTQAFQAIGISTDSSHAEMIFGKAITCNASNDDNSKVFYGTQLCYLFLRMHQTIYIRLCAARELANEQIRINSRSAVHPLKQLYKANQHDSHMDVVGSTTPSGSSSGGHSSMDTADDVDEGSVPAITAKSKSPYKAFYSQLLALLDGSIDSNKFEDSCRHLLGNKSYVIYTLDKIVQRTLKCLQSMAVDEHVTKLVGLFVYNNSRSLNFDVQTYQYAAQQNLKSAAAEELYRFQYVTPKAVDACIGKGISVLGIQFLGEVGNKAALGGASASGIESKENNDDDDDMEVEKQV